MPAIISFHQIFSTKAFVLSIFFNSIIIAINIFYTNGVTQIKYRNFMNFHISIHLVFSGLHALLVPIIAVEKNVMYIFTAVQFIPTNILQVLLAVYCGVFATTIVMRLVAGFYRWDNNLHPTLYYFESYLTFVYWITFALLVGIVCGWTVSYKMAQNSYVDSIIQAPIAKTFKLNLQNVTYVALFYTTEDGWNETGIKIGFTSLAVIVGSMLASYIFSFDIWAHYVQNIQERAPPAYDRGMFNNLISQIFISSMFSYLPVLTALLLPIFQLEGHVLYSQFSIFLASYSVISPISVIWNNRFYLYPVCTHLYRLFH
ncbi:Seven TM Receptor [Caenorhabditis elegans]|uniref:Seven TM Receptor n=2 Tax=Caenorhabditis elegans TaxID=6239 RepID=O16655_CAEEL|nr:Seven TM Receptor [Caenorhabditis elegans]CCD62823.1 Seven TM Receptor [Caenorhabditis elegans]|eukprot:NP_493720.2 Uncharacterized protein CELE_C03H5.7 [Caenorhabditis elegans]